MRDILAAAVLLALPCAPAWAQAAGGEIHGRTVDEYDKGVAGITVTARRRRLRDSRTCPASVDGSCSARSRRGHTRWWRRARAWRRCACWTSTSMPGVNVDLTVVMKSVAREETITLSRACRRWTAAPRPWAPSSRHDERERIPRPLDPSGVLASTPGLVPADVDRFGADGSPPPEVQSRGARPMDTVWYVDGVEAAAAVGGRHRSPARRAWWTRSPFPRPAMTCAMRPAAPRSTW